MTSSAVVGSSAKSSFGPARQRDGDRDPLAHAARQLVRVLARAGGSGSGMPHRRSSATAALVGPRPCHVEVVAQRLGDLACRSS